MPLGNWQRGRFVKLHTCRTGLITSSPQTSLFQSGGHLPSLSHYRPEPPFSCGSVFNPLKNLSLLSQRHLGTFSLSLSPLTALSWHDSREPCVCLIPSPWSYSCPLPTRAEKRRLPLLILEVLSNLTPAPSSSPLFSYIGPLTVLQYLHVVPV